MSPKKLLSSITIALILLAAWGLCNDLYVTIGGSNLYIRTAFRLASLGNVLNWRFLGSANVDYANAVFDLMLLLGGIFSLASSGRETRLLRAAVAVIFLSSILSLLSGVGFLLFIKTSVPRTFTHIIINILYYLKYILLIYGSYRLLNYYKKTKEFDLEVHEHNDTVTAYSVTATRGQRLTNMLLDGLVAFFVFLPPLQILVFQLSQDHYSALKGIDVGRPLILAVFALCRVVYYVIFERLFAATPAKMMTETRVVDANGDEPQLPGVLGRTMARLIPLESLSFLTNGGGWHDKFSGTSVAREKPTGKSGSYYYFIPVVIVVLFAGSTFIKTELAERHDRNDYAEQKRLFNEELQRKLDHAGTNDFFALERVNVSDGSSSNGRRMSKFLKVEQLNADSISFTVVKAYGANYYEAGQKEAEQAYTGGNDTLRHITYARADLKKALATKGMSYDDAAPAGINENGYLYTIKNIDTYFQPNVKLSESYGYGHDYLNIGIQNTGWPADIIKIDVLEGDAVITSQLPIALGTHSRSQSSRLIEAKVDGDNVDFKLNITVQDTTGRTQLYQISGNSRENMSRTIKKLR
jgi:uncharacterized RDD family membrane protein YckC